jgi:predicted thioredoxin/glutaredoxin
MCVYVLLISSPQILNYLHSAEYFIQTCTSSFHWFQVLTVRGLLPCVELQWTKLCK